MHPKVRHPIGSQVLRIYLKGNQYRVHRLDTGRLFTQRSGIVSDRQGFRCFGGPYASFSMLPKDPSTRLVTGRGWYIPQ